jgi:hypothetical protein
MTPEQKAEYDSLYSAFSTAVAAARDVLRRYGMDSPEFYRADALAGDIWVKLRHLQGMKGQHWMS